jgi:osmotically-inducible protein OsmY
MRGEEVRTGMLGAVAGAGAMYAFDRRLGRRRRRQARDRLRALARRGWRGSMRLERRAQSRLYGRVMSATHRHERPKHYDDVTLAHKVASQLYRDPLVPKGRLNIDACEGVVTLRGMVDDAQTIERIVDRVRGVEGVRGVQSLLHVPGAPAPH